MEHLGFGPPTGVRRAVYLGRVGGDPGPGSAAEHLGERLRVDPVGGHLLLRAAPWQNFSAGLLGSVVMRVCGLLQCTHDEKSHHND